MKFKLIKLNGVDVSCIVKLVEQGTKHPNILGNAIVKFAFTENEFLSLSGFTIWKSQYGGYNITPPGRGRFKHCLFDPITKKKIDKLILEEFEYAEIPTINSS